jgi:hypothetical protein
VNEVSLRVRVIPSLSALHAVGCIYRPDLRQRTSRFACRVVSAVGMKPPHDGCSKVRPPKVLHAVRIGRNEPTGMTSPASRQGHRGSTSEECTNTISSLLGYGVAAPSMGLNDVPDFHIA